MTQPAPPITTSDIPRALRQGEPPKPMPAKHATAHRIANAKAAKARATYK